MAEKGMQVSDYEFRVRSCKYFYDLSTKPETCNIFNVATLDFDI